MATTQPVRNKRQVRALAEYYLKLGDARNYLLIVMCIHTALRISDLLRLKWDDVYDFDRKCFRESVCVVELKTGKTKIIALNSSVISALYICVGLIKQGNYLMLSRKGGAISRIQAYRIIRAASDALGFSSRVSCHSLRKTFGYHAWKCGVSPAVIMEIYNHSSFAVTRRYLGVTQDDKNACYLKLADIV